MSGLSRRVQVGMRRRWLLLALVLVVLLHRRPAMSAPSRRWLTSSEDDDPQRTWKIEWEAQDISNRGPTAQCTAIEGGHPYGSGISVQETVDAIASNSNSRESIANFIRRHGTDMLRMLRNKCDTTRAIVLGDSIMDDFSDNKRAWEKITDVFDGKVLNLAVRGIRTQLLPVYADWLFKNSCAEPQVVYLAAGVVSCVRDDPDEAELYAQRLANTVRIIKHYSPATQVVVQLLLPTRNDRVTRCVNSVNKILRRWLIRLPKTACVSRVDASEIITDEDGNLQADKFSDKVHLRDDTIRQYGDVIADALQPYANHEVDPSAQESTVDELSLETSASSSSEGESHDEFDWLYSRWSACGKDMCGTMTRRTSHCVRSSPNGGLETVGDELCEGVVMEVLERPCDLDFDRCNERPQGSNSRELSAPNATPADGNTTTTPDVRKIIEEGALVQTKEGGDETNPKASMAFTATSNEEELTPPVVLAVDHRQEETTTSVDVSVQSTTELPPTDSVPRESWPAGRHPSETEISAALSANNTMITTDTDFGAADSAVGDVTAARLANKSAENFDYLTVGTTLFMGKTQDISAEFSPYAGENSSSPSGSGPKAMNNGDVQRMGSNSTAASDDLPADDNKHMNDLVSGSRPEHYREGDREEVEIKSFDGERQQSRASDAGPREQTVAKGGEAADYDEKAMPSSDGDDATQHVTVQQASVDAEGANSVVDNSPQPVPQFLSMTIIVGIAVGSSIATVFGVVGLVLFSAMRSRRARTCRDEQHQGPNDNDAELQDPGPEEQGKPGLPAIVDVEEPRVATPGRADAVGETSELGGRRHGRDRPIRAAFDALRSSVSGVLRVPV